MRAPLYLVCATLVVGIRCEETSAGGGYFNNRGQLEPVNMAADQETISYLLPKLAAKYRPDSDWTGVTDPRFYLLTEMDSNEYDNQDKDKKIRGKRYNFDVNPPRQARYYNFYDDTPSLSINAPIQTLRKAYAISKIQARLSKNRKFLDNLTDSQ